MPVTLQQIEAAIKRLRQRPYERNEEGEGYERFAQQRKQFEELYRTMISSRRHVVLLMAVPADARSVLQVGPVEGGNR